MDLCYTAILVGFSASPHTKMYLPYRLCCTICLSLAKLFKGWPSWHLWPRSLLRLGDPVRCVCVCPGQPKLGQCSIAICVGRQSASGWFCTCAAPAAAAAAGEQKRGAARSLFVVHARAVPFCIPRWF